jgi:hypothetical protein
LGSGAEATLDDFGDGARRIGSISMMEVEDADENAIVYD